mgnify:CR=1 FL=1
MKSNKIFWVAIAALSFVTMVSFVYAFIQVGIAVESEKRAMRNAQEAMVAAERAKEMEAIVNQARIELEKCKSEKKW